MIDWLLGIFCSVPSRLHEETPSPRNLLEIRVKMKDEENFSSIDHVYFVTKYDGVRSKVWASQFRHKLHLAMDSLVFEALNSDQIGLYRALSSVKGEWLRSVEPEFVFNSNLAIKMGFTEESLEQSLRIHFEDARREYLAKTF